MRTYITVYRGEGPRYAIPIIATEDLEVVAATLDALRRRLGEDVPNTLRSPPAESATPSNEPLSACTYSLHWRRIPSFPVCPRHLAGIRCVASDPTSQCICERHDRILDHRKAWVTENGEFVITAEPYAVDEEALAAFIGECEDLGLAVTTDGESPYNPGNTSLITIRRRTAP
jgi:hypothetical protein